MEQQDIQYGIGSAAVGSPNAPEVDPITLEVIRYGLEAVTDEMASALQKTAFSTNIKTRQDFSCALFDSSLRLIAQSFSVPNHLGSLSVFVPKLLTRYGTGNLKPGDAVVCNDGYRSGGVHLNDVCLVAPVFVHDALIGYAATLAHHVDIGGLHPGSLGLTQEIFQEGIAIPPVLMMEDGKIKEEILHIILGNVRTPTETGGDLRAQVGGITIGIRRLQDLCIKYSPTVILEAMDELLRYAERRARHAIRALPNGEFFARGFLDDDGFSDDPVEIALQIRISDEEILYDLSGSEPQRHAPINATYAMTLSSCAYTLRCLMDSDLPTNDGFYRVLKIVAPPGTVVNAVEPAAISAGWEIGLRVCETAFEALAEAIPEKIAAGSKGSIGNVAFGGINPRNGKYFSFYETVAGGYGARKSRDGIDAIQPHGQNTENAPVEETEVNYPVTILRHELIEDSEGAGAQRGGLGVRRTYAFEGLVWLTIMADRRKFAPFGLAGGLSGKKARYVRNPDRNAVECPSKFSIELPPGDSFSVEMAGGGGYGHPYDRDPDLVAEDVRNGKVSAQRAREVYGVTVE